jgi:hypothetical protein
MTLPDSYRGTARTTGTPEERRTARKATAFKPDVVLEGLLALREENHAAFDELSTNTKLQVGYYESAKQAAEQKGDDK